MTVRIPTADEIAAHAARPDQKRWARLPDDWRCPCCHRGKNELMRYAGRKWVGTTIVLHHDHGPDDASGDRFPAMEVCNQCNTTESRAKQMLGLPARFSFAPAEIRHFAHAAPHRAHVINLERALSIYLEAASKIPAAALLARRQSKKDRDRSNAMRQERHRQQLGDAGLMRLEVRIPAGRVQEFRTIAERMRLEALELEGAQA